MVRNSTTRSCWLDICYQLPLAGLDTTNASVILTLAHLVVDRELQDALRSTPSRLPAAIEELMRFLSLIGAL
jgi:cytochrome P450